jgi:DNA-binding transcriptional MerR regulator
MSARPGSPLEALPPIPAKRYFTIGEVSELCGVKPHVLRYWEQEFSQLRPMKRRGNRRYYQHHEVLLVRRIRQLLYEEGFTINGARNRLGDGAAGMARPRSGAGSMAATAAGVTDDWSGSDTAAASPAAGAGSQALTGSVIAGSAGLNSVHVQQVALGHSSESAGMMQQSLPLETWPTDEPTRAVLRAQLLEIRALLEDAARILSSD